MPESEESSHRALERLDKRLEAFETDRAVRPGRSGVGESAADGYRMLGEMLGGVLGGVGFGWLVDHFAHTSPWGLVGGLVIGAGLSVFATVQTASRISAKAAAKLGHGAVASAPVSDEDDDD
jgi:ATP synthase protein I